MFNRKIKDPMADHIDCIFVPESTITTYELAVLLRYLFKGKINSREWDQLESQYEGITRHLQRVEDLDSEQP